MKANKQFLTRISNSNLDEVLANVSLSDKLRRLLEAPLLEYEGAIFLSQLVNETPGSVSGEDLTGWECFVNHIHVDDYVGAVHEREEEPSSVLLQGLKCAVELSEKLKNYRSDERGFRILVGYSVLDHMCTVRFHKIRPDENWLSENLEDYREEAICVLETIE